jgi:hypothetical protein
VTADDFRLPQVWRSNIALDQRLPYGIVGTAELIYSRDFNSPLAVNLAHQRTGETVRVGSRDFNVYERALPGAEGTPLNEVYYLTNINSGSYISMNIGLEKDMGFRTLHTC